MYMLGNIKSTMFKLFIIMFSIMQLHCGSDPPVWFVDPAFKMDTIIFDAAQYSSPINNQIVAVNYVASMINTTQLRNVALGLTNFDFQLQSNILDFIIELWDVSPTGFSYSVTLGNRIIFSPIKLRYLAVDYTFSQQFSVTYLSAYVSGSDQIGPNTFYYLINFTASTGVILNLSHDNALVAFTHAVQQQNVYTNALDLKIDLEVLNESFYQVAITTVTQVTLTYFIYSRIIFDKTAIQALGYVYFRYGYLASTNTNTSQLTLAYTPFFDNGIMYGMNSYNLVNQTTFQFATDISTQVTVTTSITYLKYRFGYWTLQKRQCNINYPFFNQINLLCYDDCGIRAYNDVSSSLCKPCFYPCYDCENSITCTQCSDTLDFRVLNNNTCKPIPGYYQSNVTEASPCLSNCQNCTSSSICIDCFVGFISNGSNSCLSCSLISNCLLCTNLSQCSQCQINYQLINGLCVSNCAILCATCTLNPSQCLSCLIGYILNGNQCKSICGDNIHLIGIEECDDGNLDNMDGCSSVCLIQDGFLCENSNVTQGSQCTYIKPIIFKIQTTKKLPGTNQIQITIKLQPKLKEFEKTNFSQYLKSNLPINSSQYTYDPETGTLIMLLQYTQSIQDKDALFTFDPPNTGIFKMTPTTSSKVTIQPENNQGAYFYSEKTYQLSNIMGILSMLTGIVALVLFALGLIAGKLIGVQMMGVLQLSFLGLVSLEKINPTLAQLAKISFINGFRLKQSDPITDKSMPISARGFQLFSQFWYNYNVTILIIVVPLLVGLITFILSKTVMKRKYKQLITIYTTSVGQYTFNGICFCSYIISASFAIQVSYGVKTLNAIVSYISLLYCILLLLMIIGYFVFKIIKPQFFGQFTKQFNKQFIVSQYYYPILLIQRVLSGSLIILMIKFNNLDQINRFVYYQIL